MELETALGLRGRFAGAPGRLAGSRCAAGRVRSEPGAEMKTAGATRRPCISQITNSRDLSRNFAELMPVQQAFGPPAFTASDGIALV